MWNLTDEKLSFELCNEFDKSKQIRVNFNTFFVRKDSSQVLYPMITYVYSWWLISLFFCTKKAYGIKNILEHYYYGC